MGTWVSCLLQQVQGSCIERASQHARLHPQETLEAKHNVKQLFRTTFGAEDALLNDSNQPHDIMVHIF